MEVPKHYSLVKEHDDHFELHDGRDGKKFKVAKKPLHPAHQIKIMKMKKFAEGGEVDPGDDGIEEGVTYPPPANDQIKVPDAPVDVNMMAPQVLPQEQPAQASPEMQAMQQPAPQATAQPSAYPSSNELKSAIGSGIAGIKAEAAGQQAQNTQMAAQQQKNIEEEQKFMQMRTEKMAQYQAQYDNLAKEVVNGKIDPNRYWNNKSSGDKMSAAIGILLSGLGAGISGNPNNNMALGMIQKQIDNDIEAQKVNLGNKNSLLSLNLQAQGNMEAAMHATRLQMAAIAQGKLQQVAMQTGNPIIAAKAQQQIAALQERTIPSRISLANNEIQMQIKKDVLGRLSAQGQPGAQPVDMNDLAKAGLVDPGTAEKEGAAISKRQQAEAYLTEQVKKLDKEQKIWGNGIVPNLANPNSYDRRDQYRAGIIQAIQSASSSKRLNPEMLAVEAEPFLTKTLDSEKTREEGLNGLIGLIRAHADPTPSATHYKIPGAINAESVNRKSYKMGPVK